MAAKTFDRQTAKFLAVVGENMPELSGDAMQGWIQNPKAVQKVLREVFCPPEDRGGRDFKYDERRDGWQLLEDAEFSPIDPANLELVPFLKEGEARIGGEEMVRRSREEFKSNLGQRHAEYLLERQQDIPEEFRKYYIAFTGTVWRDTDGRRRVACLDWVGRRWIKGFAWLEAAWPSRARLPRPRE